MNTVTSHDCQCEWLGDEHCDEALYKEFEGRHYCVLHYPSNEKKHDFESALRRRFDEKSENYLNFCGVWFPDSFSFAGCKFPKPADFSAARFSGDRNFSGLTFDKVDFRAAQFLGSAFFEHVTFGGEADFSYVRFELLTSFVFSTFFEDASFDQAQFGRTTDFAGAEFQAEASFDRAKFGFMANFGAARHPTSVLFLSFDREGPIQRRSRFRNASFFTASLEHCSFKNACFAEDLDFRAASVSGSVDFSATDFNRADFSGSHLAWTNFDGSFFVEAPKFNDTVFLNSAVFSTTRLPGVDFSGGVFKGHGDFTLTRFESSIAKWEADRLQECNIERRVEDRPKSIKICFNKVTFNDGLTFKGNELYQDKALLTFDDAVFEKPERIKFQSVSMPPHSFMNVDPRKFHFIDVRWGFIDKRTAIAEAEAALKKHERLYAPAMLELAYRQLAVNAEDNNRYEQAADLRYLAMEVARSMRWRRVDWLRLSWWYWLLSGYGEKVRRAFAALVVIWLAFALIYWSGDSSWWQPKQGSAFSSKATEASPPFLRPLTAAEALLYSGGVMALQKPEPLPANKRSKFFVLFETILGPLQAALLALAIRRKFMR
jgi:uncharacterized protein YjbI with pentapeptide repeats